VGLGWFDNFNPAKLVGQYYSELGTVAHDLTSGQFGPGTTLEGLWSYLQDMSVPASVSGQTPPRQNAQPQSQQQGPSSLQDLLNQLGASAGGGGTAGAPAGYTTPDGVFVNDNSPEDRYYKLVDAVWTKVYGAHPDFAQARIFHDLGVENTDQLNTILMEMPSHIKLADGTAVNIGQYESMKTTGQQMSDKYFGRPVPDTLIQQWARGGLTTPAAIQNWFYSHPASDIPADQYGAIYDAANQWTQDIWGKMK
jgi:hypothetical protein